MMADTVREKDPRAEEAFRRYDEMRAERRRFEGDWNSIAALIRPQRGGFGMDSPTLRQIAKPLSSDPVVAHGNFAAGIYAGITNPARRWAGFETPDEDLNKWQPMAEWNDKVTRAVMKSFSPSMSSFYSATYQAYADLSAFGNAGSYSEIDQGQRKFVDVTVSLSEMVAAVDFHGRVNEVGRKFRLTGRAAARQFGIKSLPKAVRKAAETGDQQKFAFVHHVLPNDRFVRRALGARGKAWLSVYACEEDMSLVRLRGYDDMPFDFPRWDVDTGFTYGTGPGMVALPSARVNNRMQDATVRAAQRAADPTKLAPDRNVIPLSGTFRPGSVVYGATDIRGNALVKSEDFNGNIGLTLEEKRAHVEAVNNAFYYTVMSLTGRTGLSDEENRVIEEARLRNWAPHADRVMEEYGARKCERRFRQLWRAGQLPPPPDGIPADMPLQVTYQSQSAMALRASEANSIRKFVGDLLPLAQVNPRYMDRIDPDAHIEALHDADAALPASMLRPREEADKLAQQRAEQAQMAQAMEMAQAGGGVMKDLAAAGAAGQGQGGER